MIRAIPLLALFLTATHAQNLVISIDGVNIDPQVKHAVQMLAVNFSTRATFNSRVPEPPTFTVTRDTDIHSNDLICMMVEAENIEKLILAYSDAGPGGAVETYALILEDVRITGLQQNVDDNGVTRDTVSFIPTKLGMVVRDTLNTEVRSFAWDYSTGQETTLNPSHPRPRGRIIVLSFRPRVAGLRLPTGIQGFLQGDDGSTAQAEELCGTVAFENLNRAFSHLVAIAVRPTAVQ